MIIDTEAKLILDQAHKDSDYMELVEHKDIDGQPGPVEKEIMEQFLSVTKAVDSILKKNPESTFQQQLDTPQYYALKALYAAKIGRDMETGIAVSALERQNLLNQALIYLQPVLALGLRPDFREGRAIYDQLAQEVQGVRDDIKDAILVETSIPKPERAKAKAEEEDTDEEPPDADADADADAADADAADADADTAENADAASED